MRKAAVRHGDPTTTGGFVIAYSSTIHDNGKQVALSGDEATCGECRGVEKSSPFWLSRMRTILLGTYAALTISLSCALLAAPIEAQACRFTIQHTIKFERSQSTLSNSERVDLAKLLIDVRNSPARRGIMVIYAYTEEGQGTAITKKRVESVTEFLRSAGVMDDRINVDYEIWRAALKVPESERFQILLEFLPGAGEKVCP